MTDKRKELERLLTELGTDPKNGLSWRDAEARLAEQGGTIPESFQAPGFFSQLKDRLQKPDLLVLLLAVAVLLLVRIVHGDSFLDGVAALSFALFYAIWEILWKEKAWRILENAGRRSPAKTMVLRDSQFSEIPGEMLVRGDIVKLRPGDVVPADVRLLETTGLHCMEEALGGGSEPVEKDAWATVLDSAGPAERRNMAFCGSQVVEGHGIGVVMATGAQTEIAQTGYIERQEPSLASPSLHQLELLDNRLRLPLGAVYGTIIVIGLLWRAAILETVLATAALAAITAPAGIAATAMPALALGARRLQDCGAAVRKLSIIEKLANVTVICAGKAGIFTEREMEVREVWAAGHQPQEVQEQLSPASLHVLRLGALCSDGGEEGDSAAENEMDLAIAAAAREKGLNKEKLLREYPLLGGIPFHPRRKRMTTIHQVGDKPVAVVKGDFDTLWPLCTQNKDGQAERQREAMAEKALRVIAVACRELPITPYEPMPELVEKELTFVGLIMLQNLPREEVKDTVSLCRSAGVRTVMTTGDHPAVARVVAGEAGILGEGDDIVTASELGHMDRERWAFSVYAGIGQEDKVGIIKEWQKQGEIVAALSSDTPVLKAADVGVAVEGTAAEAAKKVADIVVEGDSLEAVVNGVYQSRGICSNGKRLVRFSVGCKIGEMLAVLGGVLLGWGTTLLAAHLLFAGMVLHLFLALALGMEPVPRDIMQGDPKRCKSLESGEWEILLHGVTAGVLTLWGYALGAFSEISRYFPPSREIGLTMAFLVLVCSQLAQAVSARSGKSIFRIGFWGNKAMNRAMLASLGILIPVTLVPALEAAFGLVDLSIAHWLLILLLSLLPLVLSEAVKGFRALRERIV